VFARVLRTDGIAPYPGSRADRAAARRRHPIGVVSSSKNAEEVLTIAGIRDFFPVVVDGVVSAREGCAQARPRHVRGRRRMLGVDPARSAAVEDAHPASRRPRPPASASSWASTAAPGRRRCSISARRSSSTISRLSSPDDRPFRRKDGQDGSRPFSDRPVAPRGDALSLEDVGVTETLFALGNGYLGLRGNQPEGRHAHEHGTFINGFHEIFPIRHAEQAYGFAEVGQTIINAPDAKVMRVYVDDEPLSFDVADIREYERALDMRGHAHASRPVDDAERQGRRDRLRADGLLRGASSRRHARHRDGAQQRRPGDDEPPDRQPSGRQDVYGGSAPGGARRRASTRARRRRSKIASCTPRSTGRTATASRCRTG
jgi:alpha,alpha-trehalose phosphorylase